MRIQETKLYHFDELSEQAKEHAIEQNRDWNTLDDFWHECTIDDAKEIGKLLGIDVDKIYFSGFSSQGDGACFEGTYYYAKGARKAIREHAPKDAELHRIADELQSLQRRHFYGLSARVKHSGHYYHENCTTIDVTDDGYDADADTCDGLKEILRDYMRWIYRQLEREYEYQTSDESIAESLIANECEFDENGNRD